MLEHWWWLVFQSVSKNIKKKKKPQLSSALNAISDEEHLPIQSLAAPLALTLPLQAQAIAAFMMGLVSDPDTALIIEALAWQE